MTASTYSKTRRTIPFLIAVCLLSLPAYAKYSGGSGTAQDPYQIATAADLILLGETPADYDKQFLLTADIDLDPKLPGRKVFDKAVIGQIYETRFNGVFDGKGHVISDLTITGKDYLGLFGYLGDGGEVRNLGVLDVNIVGSGTAVGGLVGANGSWTTWGGSVTHCHSTGKVSGSLYVGGLVGENHGSVTQCYSAGAVNGGSGVGGLVGQNGSFKTLGSVTQCYSTGAVRGNGPVGGLVGGNDGNLVHCYSTGKVSGNGPVGGLVGRNGSFKTLGSVTHCYSTGAVSGGSSVGGLVGENTGSVTQCYSTGAVSGQWSVGGLVGDNVYYGSVTACFWDTQTSGQTASAGGTGKTTAQMQTGKTFLDAGWDFVGETTNGSEDTWKIAEGLAYPRLWWEKYRGGTGEPNDPYQIATAADLIALGETPADYDKHFLLTADIDLDPSLPGRKVFDKAVMAPDTDPTKEYFQGTPFTGVFDGDGHTISHLTIIGKDYVGLFGQLSGEVKNLGVVNVNITGSGDYVGGLVGGNSGTVTQCYSIGVVSGNCNVGGLVGYNEGSVTGSHSTGTVDGNVFVGGLVGCSGYGTVTQCSSSGAVSGLDRVGGLVGHNYGGTVTQCYSTGAVAGEDGVGGLAGASGDPDTYEGAIIDSYSTGAVSGTGWDVGGLVGWNLGGVTQCYSTGAVSGQNGGGGLVGSNSFYWGGTVTACFWDVQTSGQAKSAAGTGKTTAQMQDPNTFMVVRWDFVGQADGPHDIWAEPKGGGYPILSWQLPPLQGLPRFSGGTGEPNDPYMISRPEELNSIGHNPRLMKCHFKLVSDLDLTGIRFYPIGGADYPYGGVFDGNGHTISDLTINGRSHVGLFGQLASGAEVRDLGVVDVNITGAGDYVGGLVGSNGSWNSPGGRVTRCYSSGEVTGTGQYASVGGLVGYNSGTVAQCYSTGKVSGTQSVGGLVGGIWRTVTASFWDRQTSGQATSAGGTGKTTAQMQTASTFLDAGWDFVGETKNGTEDIWWILEGKDYPCLWWEAHN